VDDQVTAGAPRPKPAGAADAWGSTPPRGAAASFDDTSEEHTMSVLDQDTTTTEYETRLNELLAAVQAGGPDKADLATAAPADLIAKGVVNFATAFIYGTLTADLTFDGSGEKIHFSGSHWGLGLGGGTSYGVAAFSVPPRALMGEGTYEVHSLAGGAGYVSVIFQKNGRLVGAFMGAALAVNASVAGGSGTWTMG
jgi:hypothetical protein